MNRIRSYITENSWSIFFFTINGEGILECGEKECRATSNTVTILSPNEYTHYFTAPGKYWEFYWIHINPQNVHAQFLENIIRERGWHYTLPNIKNLCAYIDQMLDYNFIGIKNEIFISKEVSELLHDLLDASVIKYQNDADNNAFVKKVLAYIEKNYMNNLTIEDISAETFVSVNCVIRILKNIRDIPRMLILKNTA